MAGVLLGVAALVVVVAIAVRGEGDTAAGVDRPSYEAGYEALGGAYLPPSDEGRATVEARCEEMYGGAPDSGRYDLDDWVAGCADFVENKDSRFSSK
ncbi:hypothetical protein ACWEDZ_01950 [Streptomyces sp. NPDC005047]